MKFARFLIVIFAAMVICASAITGVFAQSDQESAQEPDAPAVAAPVRQIGPVPGFALMFAVVAFDGTLVRGNGATSASALGTGRYEVIFNRNVQSNTCAYIATLSGISFSEPRGTIYATERTTTELGIFVATRNLNGDLADLDFHVLIICNETEIFADGFESGDTSAWSATVP